MSGHRFVLIALSCSFLLGGCQDEPLPHFSEPMTFVGGAELALGADGSATLTQKNPLTVPADVLNQGMEAYTNYCYACHGSKGDGRGPASWGLRPAPRDFRITTYKFSGVAEGLPPDQNLWDLVKNGLHGTAMLEWDVPDKELYAIMQYIKTFSPKGEGWLDLEFGEIGETVVAPADPWAGKKPEAIARGKAIYHAFAQCHQCHPAYATRMEIYEASLEVGNQPIVDFRDDLYFPEPKRSKSYKVAWEVKEKVEPAHDEAHGDGHGHGHHGPKTVTKMVEHDALILPPDFTFSKVRAAATPEELFVVLGAGISGTAMPSWYNTIPSNDKLKGNDDLYAMAHYVHSLMQLDDKAAQALRKTLMTQPEFVAPTAEAEEGAEGSEGSEPGAGSEEPQE
ncbi:MAG TPA: hypothetical protein DIU15_18330 [Deltaproteobacteria bacterium]|nr:hypothetical protein [Deltaproteobacteria bacterium]HCP48004.1 hypothetical protein [Deltaproteobacteria bacterium]